MHPDFSAAKIEKKVRKLREQIRYYQGDGTKEDEKEEPVVGMGQIIKHTKICHKT